MEHDGHQHHAPAREPAGSHGMLLVGEKTAFLSHLPMFMSPHDWQVILEATFTKPGSDPGRAYADDRAKNPNERVYTIDPKPFVLPDLFPADASHPARLRAFEASVFRGHFERTTPRKPVATDVVVNVTNVVLSRKFDPAARPAAQLEYVLFGKGTDLFLTHLITRPPDFDQTLSVKVVGRQLTDAELRRGITITIPGRANSAKARAREGTTVSGVMQLGGKSVPVEIKLVAELYFEERELASQM
jgi:hypothetical protein